jgi:hypothetical protein
MTSKAAAGLDLGYSTGPPAVAAAWRGGLRRAGRGAAVGATTYEADSRHVVMLSSPGLVTDVIRRRELSPSGLTHTAVSSREISPVLVGTSTAL